MYVHKIASMIHVLTMCVCAHVCVCANACMCVCVYVCICVCSTEGNILLSNLKMLIESLLWLKTFWDDAYWLFVITCILLLVIFFYFIHKKFCILCSSRVLLLFITLCFSVFSTHAGSKGRFGCCVL
jgi:hypothetical protein